MPSERGRPRGSFLVHGTLTSYTRHRCRCEACGAAALAYQRKRTASRKLRTTEPPREVLADIVIMPGAPRAQCPVCMFGFRAGSFEYWPAVERRGERWLYGCESGHRWFADVS